MKKIALDQTDERPAQIAKAIRHAILSGELTADDRLPSESDLAETYDV